MWQQDLDCSTPNGSYLEMSFIGELHSLKVAVVGAGVTGRATVKYLVDVLQNHP